MTLKRLALLPSIAVLALSGFAQQTTAPVSTIPAATAVAQARQALGVSSSSAPLSATGEVLFASTGQTSPISIDVVSPSIYRIQVGAGDSAYMWVANNGAASSQSNGVVHRQLLHASFFQRCELIPVQGVLADDGYVASSQLAPSAASANTVLQFTYQLPGPPDSFAVTKQVELDPTTFLPVKTREVQVNEGNPAVQSQFEYIYGDYRKVGNLMIPYTINVYVDGQLEQTVTIQQIGPNTSLSAASFVVGGK